MTARLAVGLAVLSAVLAVGGLFLGFALPAAWQPAHSNGGAPITPDFAAAVAFPALGAFILAQRPGFRLAWLVIAGGLGCAVKLSVHTAMLAAASSGHLELAGMLRWPAHIGWVVGGALLAGLLPLYLPDGKLPSPRWRPVVPIAVALMVVEIARSAVRPDPESLAGYPWPQLLSNPMAWDAFGLNRPLQIVYGFAIQAMLVLGVVCFVVRARRGDALVRRQIAWPATGYAVYVAGLLAGPAFWLPAQLAVVFTAVSIAFSVLKHRLFDIDVLVGRALVGGGIFAAVAAVYLTVSGLTSVLVSGYDSLAGLAAAAVAGVFFHPLRLWLRRLVDQAMYGTHGDPRRLAQRLAAEVGSADPMRALGVVAEVTMDGLGVTSLSVQVRDGRRVDLGPSGPGQVPGGWRREVPLVWHGEPVGMLLVGPAGPRHFSADHLDRLIAAAVLYMADVAHAVRMSTDLQRSRETILNAREEERRRLRRDLHEGLGPALAGLSSSLTVARTSLRTSPAAAERLLGDLREGMNGVAQEVRELVHGLSPPLLESLGLEGAIRALAGPGVKITVSGLPHAVGSGPPHRLPGTVGSGPPDRLPGTVETAAFRIVQAALANVTRHARASATTVELWTEGESLRIRVDDDGVGLPERPRPGLGTVSMRERAAELGGSCTVSPRPGGGTRVDATLATYRHSDDR